MSLRSNRKKPLSAITEAELNHLRNINNKQAMAENSGLSADYASRINSEEKVFFKSGDAKGKLLVGGEVALINLGDNPIGTTTYIEYEDKHGRKTTSSTVITKDKKLIDSSGKIIRELY